MKRRRILGVVIGVVAVIASVVIFLIPFAFILVTAAKTTQESANLDFSWPTTWQLWDNIKNVLTVRRYVVLRAFINSTTLTVLSVGIMVILSAMIGYVLQRRSSRWNPLVNFLVLAGLIIPPAVVPTIWMLQEIGLFKQMIGMILVNVAFGLPFCILLFRAFVSSIPRELDEAATVDGAGPIRLFFSVVMPLLKPVVITVIVVQAVAVFNDFTGPLYFLPGSQNVTVQLTLYNFQSQMLSQWNLLFTNILLITIPPLVMYIFFNRQIVAGMTSGAVKG
ncbi:MAG TPA: carbohydrate ABC transporter permease [Microlunatus sp.]|nr:carbohydrate ABC transporter permease [Microlunatus sp.]